MDEIDNVIAQPARMRILAVLYRNREADQAWVRDRLGLTDGNLGSHVQRLEKAGYVKVTRRLTTGGFRARIRITPAGDAAFQRLLASLQALLEAPVASATPTETPAVALGDHSTPNP